MRSLVLALTESRRLVAPVALIALLAAVPCWARGFTGSGEAVTYRNGQELQRWRFYWAGTRGRLDNPRTTLLVDLAASKAYMLNLEKKLYSALPAGAANPVAAIKDFCKEHPSARKHPNASCLKEKQETVAGRRTTKWVVRSAGGEMLVSANIDFKHGFIVRLRDGAEVQELEQLNEKRPSAQLFKIPSGYRQVDRAALMSSFQ